MGRRCYRGAPRATRRVERHSVEAQTRWERVGRGGSWRWVGWRGAACVHAFRAVAGFRSPIGRGSGLIEAVGPSSRGRWSWGRHLREVALRPRRPARVAGLVEAA